MTDRTERGPRGRKPGRKRPGSGGPPERTVPRRPAKDDEARTGQRADGTPHSKRFGRRPPKEVREGGPGAGGGRPADKRDDRPRKSGPRTERPPSGDRPWRGDRDDRPEAGRSDRPRGAGGPWKKPFRKSDGPRRTPRRDEDSPSDGLMRLNRYLANAGVASRRDADDLIKAGVVTVNGIIVTEMGAKVGPNDKVHYGGQRLSAEKKRYVLINKPKNFITTTDDPMDRRTVMALIEKACTERLYPVGRLDRNTTGVLLMTNDGDLAKRLTHPSHGAEKLYHVTLDKPVTKADLNQLLEGVPLDDGPARADEAKYVEGTARREVGLKIHMGRNRIVRRMFEALGYEVVKLDRVLFAGLTKKDLQRGHWRHLTDKEVLFLTKRK